MTGHDILSLCSALSQLPTGWGWDNFPPHNSSIALYYVSHPVRAIGLGFGLNLPKGQMIHAPVPIKKVRRREGLSFPM